jgi:hypothetical protein
MIDFLALLELIRLKRVKVYSGNVRGHPCLPPVGPRRAPPRCIGAREKT